MEMILPLGITIILFLQSLGTWLVGPMKLITFLGNEEFYLFIAPAILWCLNYRLGLCMGVGLMFTSIINTYFKFLFHSPRPYWYDSRVKAYTHETSFGVPSGHSQNAVVVWGILASWFRRSWAWVVAILLMLLIGFSRMVLGVHFPHDVLVGWLIGALVLWGFLAWEKPVSAWFGKKRSTDQVLIALAVSLAMILVGGLIQLLLGGWRVPETWASLATQQYPEETIAPLSLSGLVSNTGVFFGLVLGAIYLRQRGGFDAGGPAWKRLVRFLLGLVGVFALWFGLGAIFPRGDALIPYALRYIRYALVGFWIAGLAPYLFLKLKLAQLAQSS